MIPFLQNVAASYYDKYGSELSRFCFVFPNKRSGVFFRKYLNSALERDKALVCPEITTFSAWTEELTGKVADNQLSLLFHLYDAYLAVKGKEQGDRPPHSFDEFWPWGLMALQDFDDVDRSLADASSVFENVKDINELRSDYLTDEQKEVLKDYFGVELPVNSKHDFWLHLHNSGNKRKEDSKGKEKIDIKEKFCYLWDTLGALYGEFGKVLEREGLTYDGKAYREAWDLIEEKGLPSKWDRVVFVGFYNLSLAEWKIFRRLKENGCADFVWDFTGIESVRHSAELQFMLHHIEQFPKPEWLKLLGSESGSLPQKMEVISVPSNVIQAKVAGELAGKIKKEAKSDTFKNAEAAVVLPDEGLLMPMLYSLPEEVQEVNLSIGYPLSQTPALSLVSLLRRLQSRKRQVKDSSGNKVWGFYHEDISLLLSHPLMLLWMGNDAVTAIKDYMTKFRKFILTAKEMAETSKCGKVEEVFQGFDALSTGKELMGYLKHLLTSMMEFLEGEAAEDKNSVNDLNAAHIASYLEVLDVLEDCMVEHKISFSYVTMFILADKLIGTIKIPIAGEPLEGLQIVGLLETRCLDFKYLIVASMNEQIFPQRIRSKSFIPENLKKEYGIPGRTMKEKSYTYLFYRMISRAQEVYFLYDARIGGVKSSDASRYLLQLKNLYARNSEGNENEKLKWTECDFILNTGKESDLVIPKEEIKEELDRFRPGGDLSFSPTSITKYLECPLKFYFGTVKKIPDDPAPTEFMDAALQGTIIHEVMQNLYVPEPHLHGMMLQYPRNITKEKVKEFLNRPKIIMEELTRVINRLYLHLPPEKLDTPLEGDAAITAKGMLAIIRVFLEADYKYAPFDILGCEISNKRNGEKTPFPFSITDGDETVACNMAFAIDRVDGKREEDGTYRIRIVDYKSGSAHLETKGWDELFGEESFKGQNIIQLMCYANLLSAMRNNEKEGYSMKIYNTKELQDEKKNGIPSVNNHPILHHLQDAGDGKTANEIFLEHLYSTLNEIFDCSPGYTFTRGKNARCSSCNFAPLCGR